MDCTHCGLEGDLVECQKEICSVQTTWYAKALQERIDELETAQAKKIVDDYFNREG
jgi:hypothetical protein